MGELIELAWPFRQEVIAYEAEEDGTSMVTLACGHVVCLIGWAYQSTHPCIQCREDFLRRLQKP